MIIKSYELKKLDLNKNKYILFYGANEGAKTDEINRLNKTFNLMIDRLQSQQEKLLLSERHEAWENVARKLAHEIKNPLTPIQLSIDRLREKYSKKINEDKKDFEAYLKTINNQIKTIISQQSRIDVLVNNAGINIPEHFTQVKTKNMECLVKVNTIATFNIAQLCAIKMIKLKNRKKVGGSIINMTSQMGHVGGAIRSVYNMNKWGLEGLTKGMAVDLAKYNIRVNAVAPTFVVTPMTKKFLKNKKFKKETLNNIPLGRFAEMSEIASTVVFLASDAASMIHGTSILVDGGWTAK